MTVRHRKGSCMLYAAVSFATLCALTSLAVDYGRVEVARAQLQAAADAAARYAVSGVKHEIGGVSAAQGMARANLRENRVDSRALLDSQATIEVGRWRTSSKKFSVESDVDRINAVRVTVKCSAADNTAIPLLFGMLIGKSSQELTATAVAMMENDNGTNAEAYYQQRYVPATSNLWLAGMPNGTKANVGNPANNPDTAGSSFQSPIYFNGLSLRSGSTLTFDGVNGGANNLASNIYYNGDGNQSWIVSNFGGSEHGKSNVTAPINSVVAVFLNDNQPSGTPPASLDFATTTSRDFTSLSPQVNQTFFIGDGRRDNGDIQQFVIPPGATRLMIGTMDGYEWNNNIGGFTVTVTTTPKIKLVR